MQAAERRNASPGQELNMVGGGEVRDSFLDETKPGS